MTIGRLAWIIGAAILVLVVNVAISFLYVAFYSYVIKPGHDEAFYQEYAKVAAPYCSLIAGMPLMFLMGWWAGSWWEPAFAVKAAIFVWVVYAVIDLLVVIGAGMSQGMPARMIVLVAVSLITKFAAAYFGGVVAGRQV